MARVHDAIGQPWSPRIDERTLRSFWDEALALPAGVRPDPRLTARTDHEPYESFDMEFAGAGEVTLHARLSRPAATPDPLPLIVTAPGFAGWEQGVSLSECQRGFVVCQVWPRGQGHSYDAHPIEHDAKLTANLDDPLRHYYRLAYVDMVVAVTAASQLPFVDASRIAAVGTSQGGGLALALAALDPRVRAVVANLPFLCDLRESASVPGSVAHTLLDRAGLRNPPHLAALDYIDAANLAQWIRAPTLVIAGGRDESCPPTGIRAAYDRLAGVRAELYEPELGHEPSLAAYDATWWWLERHLAGGS
jgi:cephalosporin-C deacetylase